MKGLVIELSIPRYVLAKGIGGSVPEVAPSSHPASRVRPARRTAVLELLARREGPAPGMLVTHPLALARYQEAIEANLAHGHFQAVKTVFALTVNP